MSVDIGTGPDGPWIVDCSVMAPPGTARSLDLTPLAYFPQGENGDKCPTGYTLTPYTWDASSKSCISGGQSFQQADSGSAQMCNMRSAAPDPSGATPRLWAIGPPRRHTPGPPTPFIPSNQPMPQPISLPATLTAGNVGQVIQNRLGPVANAIDNLVPLIKASVVKIATQTFNGIISGIATQPQQIDVFQNPRRGGAIYRPPAPPGRYPVRAPIRQPTRPQIPQSTLTPEQLDEALERRIAPMLNTVSNMDAVVQQSIAEIASNILNPVRMVPPEGEPISEGGGRNSATRRRRRGTKRR